jgi:hypothetical protein
MSALAVQDHAVHCVLDRMTPEARELSVYREGQ